MNETFIVPKEAMLAEIRKYVEEEFKKTGLPGKVTDIEWIEEGLRVKYDGT